MPAKSVAEMNLQAWSDRNRKLGGVSFAEIGREMETTRQFVHSLQGAVAHFLYLASKDVPPADASLYRAAALRLVDEPVDPKLMDKAFYSKSNDEPLLAHAHKPPTDLMELWLYHHRVEIEAAERAYDATRTLTDRE